MQNIQTASPGWEFLSIHKIKVFTVFKLEKKWKWTKDQGEDKG